MRLVISKGTSGETRNRILAEEGDVEVINATLLADLEPRGKIMPGTATVDPAGGSALGKHMQVVADNLGVGDEPRRKLKVYEIGVAVGEAVAKGDAEIGIGFIPEFNSVSNIAIAGPLPGKADFSSVTTAVILEGVKDQASARALIAFLRSPAAQKAIRARGMEPL